MGCPKDNPEPRAVAAANAMELWMHGALDARKKLLDISVLKTPQAHLIMCVAGKFHHMEHPWIWIRTYHSGGLPTLWGATLWGARESQATDFGSDPIWIRTYPFLRKDIENPST